MTADEAPKEAPALVRPAEGRWAGGVCAACAKATGWPVWLIRLAFLGSASMLLLAPWAYIVAGSMGATWALAGIGAAGPLLYTGCALSIPYEKPIRGRFTWDFVSSTTMLLVATVLGHFVLVQTTPYWNAGRAAVLEDGYVGWVSWIGRYMEDPGLSLRDVLFGLFLLSSLVYAFLSRRALGNFFRSMNVGVAVVALFMGAVGLGVLVPQIDGFEDLKKRVDLEREYEDLVRFESNEWEKLPRALEDGHEQYSAFRWAEGYFLYHVLHLYGIGMPSKEELPATVVESLDRFGDKYGKEERDNREKQMTTAFAAGDRTAEIAEFIARHERRLWRAFELSTWLHLNRTYESDWFAALTFLMFLGVLVNAFKYPLSRLLGIQKIGFFTVHVGMMILLIGGGVSKGCTDRGIIHLDTRYAPTDIFYNFYDTNQPTKLPFHLRLDRFARQDWKTLEVHFPDERFTSRVPSYTLWEGRTFDLDYVEDDDGTERPRLRFEVLGLHESAAVGVPFVEEAPADDASGTEPLFEYEFESQLRADEMVRGLMIPGFEQHELHHPDFRLAARHGEWSGSGPIPADWFPAQEGRLGVLKTELASEGDATAVTVPLQIGARIEVAGGFQVVVRDATSNFQLDLDSAQVLRDPRPLEEQPYVRTAVWVDVYPPEEGGEVEPRRILLEDIDPVAHDRQSRFLHDELVIRYEWNRWEAPGPPRHVVHWGGSDGGPVLVAETGEIEPLRRGEALPLPGTDLEVVALDFYERARVSHNDMIFAEREIGDDGWDESFYSTDPKGLELAVTFDPGTPEERTETIELASVRDSAASLWFSPDDSFYVEFYENTAMMPFEWRSVLSVLKEDNAGELYEASLGSERQREIRVNDYLYFEGYRFFQTNAIPEIPTYSGVGVVYDPGIELVILGMYTIIAGTAIAFLVRPLVKNRRGESATAS